MMFALYIFNGHIKMLTLPDIPLFSKCVCAWVVHAEGMVTACTHVLLFCLQVLPPHIIRRLAQGQAYAPEHHDQVSVLLLPTSMLALCSLL